MLRPADLQVTLRQRERLERLHRRYGRDPLPLDLPEIIHEQLGVNLAGRYGTHALRHPFVVASGDLTASAERVLRAAEAGWAAIVLKTAAVEDEQGDCDLGRLRRPPRPPISRYAEDDAGRERPMLVWDGRLFPGDIQQYAAMAGEAVASAQGSGALIAASLTGGMPVDPDDPCLRAWRHTGAQIRAAGITTAEVTMEPLKAAAREVAPDAPGAVIEALGGLEIVLRPGEAGLGLDTLAAGVVAVSRITARDRQPGVTPSAVGGVYTGLRALDYILQGAGSVQVYSFIAGKVRTWAKRSFNKFEQVLYRLLLDPADGLVLGMLHLKNSAGVASVLDAARERREGV